MTGAVRLEQPQCDKAAIDRGLARYLETGSAAVLVVGAAALVDPHLGDGDPVDVLVVTPYPVTPGSVVPCRAVGMLVMEDEARRAFIVLMHGDRKVSTKNLARLALPLDLVSQFVKLPEPSASPVRHEL